MLSQLYIENIAVIRQATIDFQQGCADSTGDEKETVLMLGDDAVNKTVPLILCAEENVVGNHGATIGQLDADTLFYFESRGIAREHCPVYLDGREIGMTTSGTHCPFLGKAVAMAMLDAKHAEVGTKLEVEVRGRRVAVEIIPLPFEMAAT